MKTPATAVFYVKPSMTKFEVKEYLIKIYDVDVVNVNTALFLGNVFNSFRLFLKSSRTQVGGKDFMGKEKCWRIKEETTRKHL